MAKTPKPVGWATAIADRLGHAGPHWQTINNNKALAEKLLGYKIPSKFKNPDDARRFVEDYVNIVMPERFPDMQVTAPVDTEPLPPTKQQAFDAALRAHKRRIELEFDTRVAKAAYDYLGETLLKHLKDKEADASRVLKSRKGVMTREEYRKIMSCLHPDAVTDEAKKPRYEEAFRIFQPLELVLCSEKEMPTKPSDLPRTVEELLKRKKTKR